MPFGMIGSVIGGFLGLKGQKSANRANERMTSETNELNAELSREVNAQNLAFSEKQNAQQLQLAKHVMHLNTPTGIRQQAEKAGFNPNVFSGSAGAFGPGYSPQLSSPNLTAPHMQTAQMGNEYAQLGVGIADAFSGYEQLQIQRAELDMERQRLEHLQKAVTLGEDVPGIYGARNAKRSGTANSASKTSDQVDGKSRPSLLRTIIGGDDADPAFKGGALATSGPVGSDRLEADKPDKTLQPISFMGMTMRGTGTTSSAQVIEDNAGDVAGSFWALPVAIDYATGTYLENVGRPFEKHIFNPAATWLMGSPDKPPKKVKKPKSKKEQREFMRGAYPTVFDGLN